MVEERDGRREEELEQDEEEEDVIEYADDLVWDVGASTRTA